MSRGSGNSSMPPSSDDVLPGRMPSRQQRRAAERTQREGAASSPGAPGSAMSWAEPDEVIESLPGRCVRVRRGPRGRPRTWAWPGRSQHLEIQAPAAARIQHDLHKALCSCGREARRGPPGGGAGRGYLHRPGTCGRWRYTWSCSSTCRWSGAGELIADVTGAGGLSRVHPLMPAARPPRWPRTW